MRATNLTNQSPTNFTSLATVIPEQVTVDSSQIVAREWILQPLSQWLSETDHRTFLIKGKPGSGKTTVMAWLSGHGPEPSSEEDRELLLNFRRRVKAAHFCRALSDSISPRRMASSLSVQLQQNIPAFQNSLLSENRIDIHSTQNRIEAKTVIGVEIGLIQINALDDASNFDLNFEQPIRALYEKGFSETIVILIDALDEAEAYIGHTTISRLLGRLEGLPQQVRFVVSSREDPRIFKRLASCTADFKYSIDLANQDTDDIERYVLGRLELLQDDNVMANANRIAKAAGGIFLHARLVTEELRAGSLVLEDVVENRVPAGMSGLYTQFLNRELGDDEERWHKEYSIVFGVIAVARGSGLTSEQIEYITGIDALGAIRSCRAYLQGPNPDGPFRLFHTSFGEYLTQDDKNFHYRINAKKAHWLIANAYLRRWGGLPEGLPKLLNVSESGLYGQLNAVYHLCASGHGELVEQLLKLVDDHGLNLWHTAWDRFGDLSRYFDDLLLARKIVRPEVTAQIRYDLFASSARQKVRAILPLLLGELTKRGLLTSLQSVSYASVSEHESSRAAAYVAIFPHLSASLRSNLLGKIFSMTSRVIRTKGLCDLARVLHRDEVQKVIGQAVFNSDLKDDNLKELLIALAEANKLPFKVLLKHVLRIGTVELWLAAWESLKVEERQFALRHISAYIRGGSLDTEVVNRLAAKGLVRDAVRCAINRKGPNRSQALCHSICALASSGQDRLAFRLWRRYRCDLRRDHDSLVLTTIAGAAENPAVLAKLAKLRLLRQSAVGAHIALLLNKKLDSPLLTPEEAVAVALDYSELCEGDVADLLPLLAEIGECGLVDAILDHLRDVCKRSRSYEHVVPFIRIASAYARVAEYLGANLFKKLIENVRFLNSDARVVAVRGMVSYMDSEQALSLFLEFDYNAQEILASVLSREHQMELLTKHVPQLLPDYIPSFVSVLAPHLDDEGLMIGVRAVTRLDDSYSACWSISEISAERADKDRAKGVEAALVLLREQPMEVGLSDLAKRISPLLSYEQLPDLVQIANQMEDHWSSSFSGKVRASVAARLAALGYMSETLEIVDKLISSDQLVFVQEAASSLKSDDIDAIVHVLKTNDYFYLDQSLACLAHKMTADNVRQLLPIICPMLESGDEVFYYSMSAISRISFSIDRERFYERCLACQSSLVSAAHLSVLYDIDGSELVASQINARLSEWILESGNLAISYDPKIGEALGLLLRHACVLSESSILELIGRADEFVRREIVQDIALYLSDTAVKEIIRLMKDDSPPVSPNLMGRLARTSPEEAWSLSKKCFTTRKQCEFINSSLHWFEEEKRSELINQVLFFGDTFDIKKLARNIEYIPTYCIRDLFERVMHIEDNHGFERAEIVRVVAHHISLMRPQLVGELIDLGSAHLSRRPRHEYLKGIGAMAPMLASFGGENILIEAINSIEDSMSWWP